jgi:hypothetical protein
MVKFLFNVAWESSRHGVLLTQITGAIGDRFTMHETVRQAITDLTALSKAMNSKDAERIAEIIERLRNSGPTDQHSTALYKELAR